MTDQSSPILALHIVWHHAFPPGQDLADRLYEHFAGDRYKDVGGARGISLILHDGSLPDSSSPWEIDLNGAEMTAVVVLADSSLTNKDSMLDQISELEVEAQERKFLMRLFPVWMESGEIDTHFASQAILWNDDESIDNEEKFRRLTAKLTHEFCRMARYYLDDNRDSKTAEELHDSYLEKIKLFLSHSKHDGNDGQLGDGELIARGIREWLHSHGPASSFLDTYDIPPGTPFVQVLEREVDRCAMIALHTDSYSSREWCRWEIIEAKRRHVPMVVVECMRDIDHKTIPYMGNVPCIRANPEQFGERISTVIDSVLTEVFRNYLWECCVHHLKEHHGEVVFLSRPPELISVMSQVNDYGTDTIVVYPNPRIQTHEEKLFGDILPRVEVMTLFEWQERVA